jgi:membrane fusion protein (multidrug efflux system)
MLLLAAWGWWLTGTELPLYEVSERARLESGDQVHPLEALEPGRVVAVELALGKQVHAGQVLVQLDDTPQRLEWEEQRARWAGSLQELEAARAELAAAREAVARSRQATRLSREEAESREREAEAAASRAGAELERVRHLRARGHVSESELQGLQAESTRWSASAQAARLAVSRVEWEQRRDESERQARVDGLRRQVARLEAQVGEAELAVSRLKEAVARRALRSPVDGWLGEGSTIRVGSVLREGERLGAVVPRGALRLVAEFSPAAVGRLQPGQPAWLRLEAFPWAQYGTVSTRVARVGTEVREGLVRVELEVLPGASLPLRHGLTGSVEVEVERVPPALLVLRGGGVYLGPAAREAKGPDVSPSW